MMKRNEMIGFAFIVVLIFSAAMSTSASAFKLEWEVCEAEAGGKFENHLCGRQGGAGGWEWKKLAGTIDVKSSGEAFDLDAAGKEVKCTTVEDEGTLTGGHPGTDKMTKIEFTGCTTSVAACKVRTMGSVAGTIVVKEIPTKLSERETAEAVKVLADVFEQNPTTKEFATLLFEPAGNCAQFGASTKVKGIVSAECENNTTTGQFVSDFPDPELEGNTLQAFGIAASLFGDFTTERSGVGAGWGIRCV